MATVSCPQCFERLELPDNAAGNPLTCPECQKVFTPAANTGVASGEPPARSDAESGVSENAPRTGRNWGHLDDSHSVKKRDIVKKSSSALPILIVLGVGAIGILICGIPVLLWSGLIPVWQVDRRQADAAVIAEKRAQGKAIEDQAPNIPVQKNPVAEAAAKIQFGANKDAFVTIECWENGKPSDRFAKVELRLIQPNGELAIEVNERPGQDKTVCEIAIGDGLGLSPFFFELPVQEKTVVSPVPAQIVVKDGVPARFCYVCIGKDAVLRPNETHEDLARRVEYAFVLSLGEQEKN